jgi:hypothetical protein
MEHTPPENVLSGADAPRRRGAPLRTAERAAAFLTEALGERITAQQIFYWVAERRIRFRKFGHLLTFEPDELLDDVRGTEPPEKEAAA